MSLTITRWEEESHSIRDIKAYEHIRIEYGWDEDQGYWIKVMDDRLEMKDDFRAPDHMMAEIDHFRAHVLDGGQKGCYLSAYTGPRGEGKKVDFEVMIDLWDLYKVPNEKKIFGEFRNMSDREIEEVIETIDEKQDDEWVNPWIGAGTNCECEAFKGSEPSQGNDADDEDEDA